MNDIIQNLFNLFRDKMNEYREKYEKTGNIEYDVKSSKFGGAASALYDNFQEGKTLEDFLNRMKYLEKDALERKKIYPDVADQIEIEYSVFQEVIEETEKALYGITNEGIELTKNIYNFQLVLDEDVFANAQVEAWTEELAIDAVYTYIREHVKAKMIK